jgi:hypothetical protein
MKTKMEETQGNLFIEKEAWNNPHRKVHIISWKGL